MNAELKIYQDASHWCVEVCVNGELITTYAKESLGAVLLADDNPIGSVTWISNS